MTPAAFRSAFVALAGRPNAGKSTLLNAVLGEQLAIVTTLPQTTRKNLRGIYNGDNMQIVFVDTPGIHDGKRSFNRAMVAEARNAARTGEADIVCYLVDLFREFGPEEDFVARLVSESGLPVVVVFNKRDLCADAESKKAEFRRRYPALSRAPSVTVSANSPSARDAFLTVLRPLVKEGPPLFPTDDLSDATLRFFAAEHIRKQIILHTREEVPHAVFVEIDQYRETPQRHEIEATIHVETVGQRGIVIGPKGALIAKIRKAAERELAQLAGCPIAIKCHVKVSPKWRDNPRFLRHAGYTIDT
jgi:GTP-binding protein Era